jgi:CBS domain-containing protein
MRSPELMVGDAMTIDPIVVAVDAPLETAARLLDVNAISGLPVIDAGGSLVGVISRTDMLGIGNGSVGRALRGQGSGIRVGEVMTSPAITVPMTCSLPEAARVMRNARVHRLVAIDDDGHAVGVLSAMDFVGLYAEVMR